MNWGTSKTIQQELCRLWDRGDFLQSLLQEQPHFPRRIKCKCPNSTDIREQFEAVYLWVKELQTIPYIRIEYSEINHRVHGVQRIPKSIWVDCLDDIVILLKKQKELKQFNHILGLTRCRLPILLAWLKKQPLAVISYSEQWDLILSIVEWCLVHPNPNIYLRQVDIPGVHTKFIEEHKWILSNLLDIVLPPHQINDDYQGIRQFANRYGFLDKPTFIRFRVLDQRCSILSGVTMPDILLDSDSFAKIKLPIKYVFITENEINFLAFPPINDAMIIFGKGYGWETLAKAKWLENCKIFYWGDIDTNGFAILSQLRRYFPHVISLLMDRQTLIAHEIHWGSEQAQISYEPEFLNRDEKELFDDLKSNRIQSNLRLEQERISFDWIHSQILDVI